MSFISGSIFLALNTKQMKIIESFTGFQPLEEVWIGGCYPQEFYKDLPNEIEDTFAEITERTELAFNNLEHTLTGLGVKVRKPKFSQSVDDYRDKFGNLVKPPVAPRDWCLTLGNQLWILPQGYRKEPYQHIIDEYKSKNENVEILDPVDDPRARLQFPSVVRLGKKLVVDVGHHHHINNKYEASKLRQALDLLKADYKIILSNEGSHLDGMFCPIMKGTIVSSHWGNNDFYRMAFPDWEVVWMDDLKKDTWKNEKWWMEENNSYSPVFNKHVEQKALDWVGNSLETVFEVNMLVVDEKNVICVAKHEESFNKLHKIGITPHVVDFPTKHFWDGGIHCLTVDIRRSGGCEEYFDV
jgi:hypothetical protein